MGTTNWKPRRGVGPVPRNQGVESGHLGWRGDLLGPKVLGLVIFGASQWASSL